MMDDLKAIMRETGATIALVDPTGTEAKTEQEAIMQLTGYRQLQARIKVLSTYSVGGGITVSRLNQDDHLQELHSKLRGLPSYRYLSKREQRLEATAKAYLDRSPAGVQSQLRAIPERGASAEDDKLLRELRNKIAKVVAARGYEIRSDLDAVLQRVAELQELQEEAGRIDSVLEALEEYKPDYARLLRLRYVEGKGIEMVVSEMCLSRRSFERWRPKALQAYMELTV